MKLKQIMTIGLSTAMILSAVPAETVVFAADEQTATSANESTDIEFTDSDDETTNDQTANDESIDSEAATMKFRLRKNRKLPMKLSPMRMQRLMLLNQSLMITQILLLFLMKAQMQRTRNMVMLWTVEQFRMKPVEQRLPGQFMTVENW